MKKPKLIATADGRDKLPKTKLICPTCRMWADITEIREVQP